MSLDRSILDLLTAHEVTDQGGLLDLLAAEGHPVTQPTLSRHLRKLGVVKHEGRYQRLERVAPAATVIAVRLSPPNLVILKTPPGYAQALAWRLDRSPLPHQAGTLAGDDTVFIACTEPEQLEALAAAARGLLG